MSLLGVAIYPLSFAVSTALFACGDRLDGKWRACADATGMLALCLLAAVRDTSVGTDYMTYGVWMFQSAVDNSLSGYLADNASFAPIGFNLLTWVTSHFARSLELYMFVLQLACVLPVYVALRRMKASCWAGMLAYDLLLFPASLNMMKQMIAIAFGVLALSFFLERRMAKCTACIVAALSFHQTAIVLLLVFLGCYLVDLVRSADSISTMTKNLVIYGGSVLILIITLLIAPLAVSNLAWMKESYSYQLTASGDGLNKSALVLLIWHSLLLLFLEMLRRRAGEECTARGNRFDAPLTFGLLACIGAALFQLNMVTRSLMRFGYYPLAAAVPLAGVLLLAGNDKATRIAGGLTLVVYFAYFSVACVINGGDGVIPYALTDGSI